MAKRRKNRQDKPDHITDMVGEPISAPDRAARHRHVVAGPSTNPATNLIIHDIALRSAGRLSRMAVEKAVLGKQYGTKFAKEAVENKSKTRLVLLVALWTYLIAHITWKLIH